MRGRDALFPNFDDLDVAEHTLTARLDGVRRNYADRRANAEGYVDAVHEDGRFWISKAVYEGRPVLRACVTNGRTDEGVIDGLADLLLNIG